MTAINGGVVLMIQNKKPGEDEDYKDFFQRFYFYNSYDMMSEFQEK